MQKILDNSWSGWLQENLKQKSSPDELVAILLKNGFSIDSIKSSMGTLFPFNSSLLKDSSGHFGQRAIVDYAGLAKVVNRALIQGEMSAVPNEKVQLYRVDDFLTDSECNQTIEISGKHLRPSTVVTGDRDRGYRTSSTSDLSLLKNQFIENLDDRISSMMGICNAFSEGIQSQRYDVGQQFKEHVDYFIPGTSSYLEHAHQNYGQRTWTFMVYLNDVTKGGGTRFPAIDLTFLPKKGTALLWNNLYADGQPNADTLHCGLPVEEGCKIITTKWFRELGLGPMLRR